MTDTSGEETIQVCTPEGRNQVILSMKDGANVQVKTDGQLFIKVGENASVEVGKDGKVEIEGDLGLSVKGNLDIRADGDINLRSAKSVSIRGQEVSVETQGIKTSLIQVARDGVKYLQDVASGKVRKPSYPKIDVAKFAIEHFIGKPKQPVTLPTDSEGRTIVPYSQIILLANKPDQEALPPAEVVEGTIVKDEPDNGNNDRVY